MSVSEGSTYTLHAIQVFKFLHILLVQSFIASCDELLFVHGVSIASRCIRVCAQHPAYIRCAPMYTHDSNGPTWRMSSRAIKGPVGKRLMTICPEHVSERPPGNKGPLRRRLLSFSAPEPLDPSSPRTVVGKATAQPASREQWVSLSLRFSLASFLSLFPSASLLARRSGLRFLRGTRLRSPAASCLPYFSLTHRLFPFRRPTHYRTSPSDCPPWSRSSVAPRFQRAIVFEGDRLSSFHHDISNLHSWEKGKWQTCRKKWQILIIQLFNIYEGHLTAD